MNSLRRSKGFRDQLASADDIRFLLAAVMWFVFVCTTVMAFADGIPWRPVWLALLVLTVIRGASITLATIGSQLSCRW
jgi:cell shape-determining protein MreD